MNIIKTGFYLIIAIDLLFANLCFSDTAPVSRSDFNYITDIDIVSEVTQVGLGAQYDDNESSGVLVGPPGAIAAQSHAIDINRQRRIQALYNLAPFYHMVDGGRVSSYVESRIGRELNKLNKNAVLVEHRHNQDKVRKRRYFKKNREANKAVLFINTSYSISENGNQIQVVSDAEYYIPTKTKPYKKTEVNKWTVIWQSKSRDIHWALSTPDQVAHLVNQAKDYYGVKIKKSRKTEKKTFKRKLKQKIKLYNKAPALKYVPARRNVNWTEANLQASVLVGVDYVIQHLFDMYINPIEKRLIKKSRVGYPYARDSHHSYSKQKEKRVVEIDSIEIDGYSVYQSDENIRYIIPDGEIIWTPFEHMVFKPGGS